MQAKTWKFQRIINEETVLLPLSFCILLAGGVIWLTNLAFQVGATADTVTTLEKDQKKRDAELNRKFELIMEDLGFIRGRIEKGK